MRLSKSAKPLLVKIGISAILAVFLFSKNHSMDAFFKAWKLKEYAK